MGLEVLDPILRKIFAVKGDSSTGAMLTRHTPAQGVVQLTTAGQPYPSGYFCLIKSVEGGTITLTFANGTTDTILLPEGTYRVDAAVVSWTAGTATATVANYS